MPPIERQGGHLWRFEGGAEAYAAFLKRFTTTNLTPDEIHAIGLREVARIEKEMDAIFRSLGRTEGTVNERWRSCSKTARTRRPTEGRAQIMADIDVMIRDAEHRSALLFDRRPKSACHRAAVSGVPLAERRRQLHRAAARRIAARHFSDAAAPRVA